MIHLYTKLQVATILLLELALKFSYLKPTEQSPKLFKIVIKAFKSLSLRSFTVLSLISLHQAPLYSNLIKPLDIS